MREFALPGGGKTKLVEEKGQVWFTRSKSSSGKSKSGKQKQERRSLGNKKKGNPEERYKFPKVRNEEELFETTDFGKELRKHVEKAKIEGKEGYRFKQDFGECCEGDFFYLDKSHGDHIEVFINKTKSRGIINSDGSYNVKKSKKAKHRKIK